MVLIGFTVACVSFGVVAVAYGSFPEAVRRRSLDAVVVALIVPVAIATTLSVAPTGIGPWDSALLATSTGIAAAAASAADRRVLLVLALGAVALAVGAGDGSLIAASVAVGTAAGVLALGVRLPAPKAIAGGCLALSLLSTRWSGGEGVRLGAGAAIVGLLVLAGLLRSSSTVRRRALAAGAAVLTFTVGASALAGWHALSARDELQRAADLARGGLAAARDGRLEDATASLAAAHVDFTRALDRLDRWSARPARLVPGVAQNHRVLRALAAAGADLAAASVDVSTEVEVDDLRLRRGALDLALVAEARRGLAELAGFLDDASGELQRARSPLLLPPVADALDEFVVELADANRSTDLSLEVLRVLPELLGENGPRRWFVALQAGAEYRATGGIIGSHGILTAESGRLTLGELRRTAELNVASGRTLVGPDQYVARYARYQPELAWQNITLSPDGPSVAQVVEGLYPQTGAAPVDGVLLVDHVALAALLRLTGPVEVAGWPEPLTADNLAPILLHEQYVRYPLPERVDFLADAATGVFERITDGDLPAPNEVLDVLADAVAGRHLVLHSTRGREQALFARVGADGAMPPVVGDFLALVTQNASGNKIDWFLRRSLTYEATVEADGRVDAELTVRLHNGAPASGLPHYVIGGVGDDATADGENRMIFSVYTPLELEAASIDGRPLELTTERELGRNVHEVRLTLPPGGESTVRLRLRGTVAMSDGYVLDVRSQPTVAPDEIEVVLAGGGVRARTTHYLAERDRRVRG